MDKKELALWDYFIKHIETNITNNIFHRKHHEKRRKPVEYNRHQPVNQERTEKRRVQSN
jgi:hypothetical protein